MSAENDDAVPARSLQNSKALSTPLVPLTPLSEASGLCGGPGQMSCDDANELIQDYLDNHADTESSAQVREHMGDCPPCESEFVVYQRIIVALSRCREDPPAETRERLEHFCRGLACADESDPSDPSGLG